MSDFFAALPKLIPFAFLVVLAAIAVSELVILRDKPAAAGAVLDRWKRWALQTTAIQPVCFFVYLMLICGCHFHAEAIPAGLVPVIWGFYTLFCYRTRGEHFVGIAGGALAFYWLYLTWDSNIKFAFIR
jgi:hypothetical protein